MSTHGVIAKNDPDGGWIGRYHHFDSYPSGLGIALLDAYDHFDHDPDQMIAYLIDGEPVGWYTIVGVDWNSPKGWNERVGRGEPFGPQSYSERGETEPVDPEGEWIYVIMPTGLQVHHACTGRTALVGWGDRDRMRSLEAMP